MPLAGIGRSPRDDCVRYLGPVAPAGFCGPDPAAPGGVYSRQSKLRWLPHSAMLRTSYRPELHYMRGPGPKWREKYARLIAH